MVTYRGDGAWGTGKGSNLSAAEVDGNFWQLAQDIAAVSATGANGIADIVVAGSQMTIVLDDGTNLGPYTLPRAVIRYRGAWAAGVSYAELDTFTAPNNAGIYMVVRAHTAAATFDRNASDAGGPLYQWLFPTQATTLAVLSDVSDTLPVDGQALVWSDTASAWVPGAGGGGGGGTLEDLTNVDEFLSPSPGDTLIYDDFDGIWYAGKPDTGLNDLTDVSASFPGEGEVITWDQVQSRWEARAPTLPAAGVYTYTTGAVNTLHINHPGTFVDYDAVGTQGLIQIDLDANVAAGPISNGSIIRGGQLNTGPLRIYAEAGVTLNGVDGGYADLTSQGDEYVLRKRGDNDWRISITTTTVT